MGCGSSPDGPVGGAEGAFDFAGGTIDVKKVALDVVRKYPWPCIVGAAALGFWLGRSRGRAITTAATGLATNAVLKHLSTVFDSSEF